MKAFDSVVYGQKVVLEMGGYGGRSPSAGAALACLGINNHVIILPGYL